MSPISTIALGASIAIGNIAAETPNLGELTLIEEAGFNELEITISAIGDSDTKTSQLTGTLTAQLNIDSDIGISHLFVIQDAAVQASDVTFNLGNFFVGATINTHDLAGTADTPLGIGPVDPTNGEFEAILHTFTINSGTLDGSALFTPIDINVAESPISGTGAGTGTIILSDPIEGPDFRIDYTVTLTLPVDFSGTIPTGIDGQDADIDVQGRIKAAGSAFTYRIPSYEEWATSEGLAPESRAAFTITDSLPNELIYALGLSADFSARDLLVPSASGVTFGFGESQTRDNILIEFSDDLTTWRPVPPSQFESGQALIPRGFTGNITISPEAGARFYQVSIAP